MESINFQPNSKEALDIGAPRGMLRKDRAYFSLIMRTLLFVLTGFFFISIFSFKGSDSPLKESLAWWPYQVIISNILSFLVLSKFCKKEGMQFRDLFRFEKEKLKKDLLWVVPVLLLSGVIGAAGMFGSSFLIFGTLPPATMFQPLPALALWMAVTLLPVTN